MCIICICICICIYPFSRMYHLLLMTTMHMHLFRIYAYHITSYYIGVTCIYVRQSQYSSHMNIYIFRVLLLLLLTATLAVNVRICLDNIGSVSIICLVCLISVAPTLHAHSLSHHCRSRRTCLPFPYLLALHPLLLVITISYIIYHKYHLSYIYYHMP